MLPEVYFFFFSQLLMMEMTEGMTEGMTEEMTEGMMEMTEMTEGMNQEGMIRIRDQERETGMERVMELQEATWPL